MCLSFRTRQDSLFSPDRALQGFQSLHPEHDAAEGAGVLLNRAGSATAHPHRAGGFSVSPGGSTLLLTLGAVGLLQIPADGAQRDGRALGGPALCRRAVLPPVSTGCLPWLAWGHPGYSTGKLGEKISGELCRKGATCWQDRCCDSAPCDLLTVVWFVRFQL